MKALNRNNNFHLALPGLDKPHEEDYVIVAGDVGGTKTNLSVCRVTGDGVHEIHSSSYASGDFKAFIHILQEFIRNQPNSIKRIALGVAGPVIQGRAELTNLGWTLDSFELSRELEIDQVILLNDLEATAYGLAALVNDELVTIFPGVSSVKGNMAIISPGTGLGEAGLYFDGRCLHPFPTEGGHCDFAPRSDFDRNLQVFLEKKYEVVSWEKLISGPAIPDIYEFVVASGKHPENDEVKIQMETQDPSAVISKTAMEEGCKNCMETMEHFVRFLARECSNLVLKMKATGGLFIGGGIPTKILPLIQVPEFVKHYLDGDRMEHLLEQVPIRVIMEPEAPMYGAALYAAYGKW